MDFAPALNTILPMNTKSLSPSPFAPKQTGIYTAAFASIKNAKGEVLLLQRTDMDRWCLPGGLVELGESLTDALVRECEEEIGAKVEITGFQGFYTNPDRHLFKLDDGRVLHYFAFVFDCAVDATQDFIFCPTESRAAGYFSLANLPQVVASHRYWIEDCFVSDGRPFMR